MDAIHLMALEGALEDETTGGSLAVHVPAFPYDIYDLARLARGRDSLIAGQLRITAVGLEVAPYTDELAEPPSPLPTLSGIPADLTAEEEASALRGVAGAVVRGLLQLSQASRLVRVESWPVAVVAINDAVDVNAAWLVAMAPPSSRTPRGRHHASAGPP